MAVPVQLRRRRRQAAAGRVLPEHDVGQRSSSGGSTAGSASLEARSMPRLGGAIDRVSPSISSTISGWPEALVMPTGLLDLREMGMPIPYPPAALAALASMLRS